MIRILSPTNPVALLCAFAVPVNKESSKKVNVFFMIGIF